MNADNKVDLTGSFFGEKPALLIIDMVRDNLDAGHSLPITAPALRIVPLINSLIAIFREKRWPVIFSTDSFHEGDFIFTGRLKPHSLAGTSGAEIAEDLDYRPEADTWLLKPRFSAFFQTGLENILRDQGVTLCAVAGITSAFCVLTTVMDAICHDFKAVLLEDCTTAYPESNHQKVLDVYRRNPLDPLLKVATSRELIALLS